MLEQLKRTWFTSNKFLSNDEIDWMFKEIDRLREIENTAKLVIDDIKTIHLDMSGKHRYSVKRDAYTNIEKLRGLLYEKD